MKTNANAKTVIQAVENVSKKLYEGNIVFRKSPEKLTKNVSRFTVKPLQSTKPGALTTKAGVIQAKANWQVHQDILNEILRLDPRPHIYVDTIYGRQYNSKSHATNPVHAEQGEEQPVMAESQSSSEEQPRTKRKYTKRKNVAQNQEQTETPVQVKSTSNPVDQQQNIMNIVHAIKYILQNPEVLNK